MTTEDELDSTNGDGPKHEATVFSDFRLTGALNPPRSVNFTTNELCEQVNGQIINLNPEYQRGVVWSHSKQVALIDSIFKNYYVPPIILAVQHGEDGTESKVCIDGKQRLTAINLFFKGVVHHYDTVTKSKLYYIDNWDGDRRKRLLPDKYKRIFASRQIVCVEYSGLEEDQIRDMFQRVQAGMTLNTAERMRAIAGPMTDFIKELDQTYFTNPKRHLGEKLELNDRRNTMFHNIAQLLWIFERWPDRKSAPTKTELQTWLTNSVGPSDNLHKKSHATLKYFYKLAKNERFMQRFRRTEIFAPVEFIFASILISLQKDQLTMEEIARGIALMRREIRLLFPGQVRTNKNCCSVMAEFITDLTCLKMDIKEEELEALQRIKREEAGRQREERRKSKHAVRDELQDDDGDSGYEVEGAGGDDGDDENMVVDKSEDEAKAISKEVPPLFLPMSPGRKRKRSHPPGMDEPEITHF